MEEITIYQKINDVSDLTGINENKFRVRVIKRTKSSCWYRKKEKINFFVDVDYPEALSESIFVISDHEKINKLVKKIIQQEVWKAEDFINDYKIKSNEEKRDLSKECV